MLPATAIAAEWKELVPQAPLVSTQPVQSLPQGYFEKLPTLVLERIRSEAEWETEIQALSPLLAGLSRQSPQSLPAGYFASSAQVPMAQRSKQGPAPLAKLVSFRRGFQWAVAACLAGVLVAGAYLLTVPGSNHLPSQEAMGMAVEKHLAALGEEEMDQYIQKQTQLSLLSNETSEDLNIEPEEKIQQVSEDDLLQYLEDHGDWVVANQVS